MPGTGPNSNGSNMLYDKRILLIISGGIAAYKSLEFIRRVRELGFKVRCILTEGGANFVTPLSVSALSGDKVYSELFSLTDESEMGHIRLSREADVLVVAPASANIIAKMAAGLTTDLATTALLATDKPVLLAPAMNPAMWSNAATQKNISDLESRGIKIIGPAEGNLACGETGLGRMVEPEELIRAVEFQFQEKQLGPLAGYRALVTSGPTREAIDPVRYISNYSSGKQGHAIAGALAELGAQTVLVSGPTSEAAPKGVTVINIESAEEMLHACKSVLPIDIAICAAAVTDWRSDKCYSKKIKKDHKKNSVLKLIENPDILACLSKHEEMRPELVIGFAAETENILNNASEKIQKKGCDWILANDVSASSGTFGGDRNTVCLISNKGTDRWPTLTKTAVARRLCKSIVQHLKSQKSAA